MVKKKKKTQLPQKPSSLHCHKHADNLFNLSRSLLDVWNFSDTFPDWGRKSKAHTLVKHQALAGGVPKMPGTRILNSYTHTYTINVAIKFTCKDTKLQAVQLCPELCQTRTLQITYTLPVLSLLQKTHVLTSSPVLKWAGCGELFTHLSCLNSFLHWIYYFCHSCSFSSLIQCNICRKNSPAKVKYKQQIRLIWDWGSRCPKSRN